MIPISFKRTLAKALAISLVLQGLLSTLAFCSRDVVYQNVWRWCYCSMELCTYYLIVHSCDMISILEFPQVAIAA